MATCTKKRPAPAKIKAMEEAIALLDKTNTIAEWCSDPDDGTIQEFKAWLEGATRAWLLGGSTPDALTAQLPALSEVIRNHVLVSLESQAEFLEHVTAEPGDMGKDFDEQIIAAAPAARFVRVWLKHHIPGPGSQV